MTIVTIDGKRVCGEKLSRGLRCARVPDHHGKCCPTDVPIHPKRWRQQCKVCKQMKPADAFAKNRKASSGRRSTCKVCCIPENRAEREGRGDGPCMYKTPPCHRERYQHDSGTFDAYCKQHRDLAGTRHAVVVADRRLTELQEQAEQRR